MKIKSEEVLSFLNRNLKDLIPSVLAISSCSSVSLRHGRGEINFGIVGGFIFLSRSCAHSG